MKKIVSVLFTIVIGVFSFAQTEEYGDFSITKEEGKKGDQYILINTKGKKMISSSRDIQYLNEGKFCVFDNKSSLYGVFDCNSKNGRGGFIVTPQFDQIKTISRYPELLIVFKNGLAGIMNSLDGSIILDISYDSIEYDYDAMSFLISVNGKYGLVDNTGRIVLPVDFSEIKRFFLTKMLRVEKDGLSAIYDKNNMGLWEPNTEHKYKSINAFFNEKGHYYGKTVNGKYEIIDPNGHVCSLNVNGNKVSEFDQVSAIVGKKAIESDRSFNSVILDYDDIYTYYYLASYKGNLGIVKDVWNFTTKSSLFGDDGKMELIEPFEYTKLDVLDLTRNGVKTKDYILSRGNSQFIFTDTKNFGNSQFCFSVSRNNGETLYWVDKYSAYVLLDSQKKIVDYYKMTPNENGNYKYSNFYVKLPNISGLSINGRRLSFSDSFFKNHPELVSNPIYFEYDRDEIEIKGSDSNIYTYACPFKTDNLSFFVKSDNYSSSDWMWMSEYGGPSLKYGSNSFMYDNRSYDISRISPTFKQSEYFIPISYFDTKNNIVLLHTEMYIGKPVEVVYTAPAYRYIGGHLFTFNNGENITYSEPKVSYLTQIDKATLNVKKRIVLKGFDNPNMYSRFNRIILHNREIVGRNGESDNYRVRAIVADKNNPIYILSSDYEVQYLIYPDDSDKICDFVITDKGIIMVGDNLQKGYVGFHNSVIYFFSFSQKQLIPIPDQRQKKDSFIIHIDSTEVAGEYELTYIDDYERQGGTIVKKVVSINPEN